MAEAKVSKDDAEKTALAKVPNGTIKEAEIEKEHGKLIWSFDIDHAGYEGHHGSERGRHHWRRGFRGEGIGGK